MKHIFNKILDAIAIDPRLETGIFNPLNNDHLTLFREYLINEGVSDEIAIEASNKLAESGKYPERQAFNKNGLLVTFPSPEYKQRALARGSHFERNPKTAQANIFGGETQPQAAPAAPTQSNIFDVPAQPAPATTNPSTEPASVPAQAPAVTAPTPAAPTPAAPTPAAPTPTSAEKDKPVPVNPDNRTPEEIASDAKTIEKMLKTEYTLSEAAAFGFYSKNDIWYDSEGEKIGRLCYFENRGQSLIYQC